MNAFISQLQSRFKKPEGLWYHGGALTYAFGMYALGMAGLFAEAIAINIIATLALAHGMIIAGYMLHECGHNTVFKNIDSNAKLGTALTWLCGANYGTYEDIRFKHFRHHVDRGDIVWFDYEAFFKKHRLISKMVHVLEWFYIPAHDLLMHVIMIFTSFIIPQRRDQRVRNVIAILVRGGIFFTVLYFFPKAALLYAIAYMIMVTVLRFMDSLQHDFDYTTNLFDEEKLTDKPDREWEQEHTFSNVISYKYEWPNWLVLNFGYHNAHHARPTEPWYKLPKLHRELFGDDESTVITLWPQLKIFHKFRVARILLDSPKLPNVEGKAFLKAAQEGRAPGGNAASFLTSF